MRRSPRLATRLLLGQAVVVTAGAVTLVFVAGLIAPRLFHLHLDQAGVADESVHQHAEAAFASALGIAVSVDVLAALAAAVLVSLTIVRRVASPLENLARAAEQVASGDFAVTLEDAGYTSELQQLGGSFASMAERLAHTDATRTRMLADLAHELRTPLATLQAYVDGIEDGVMPADGAAWSTMRAQIDRLRRLTSDIREVSLAEEHALMLDLRPLDLVETARGSVAAAAPRYAAKGVDLQFTSAQPVCDVTADGMRLQQVFTNLLDNALRHTASGGHVTVTVLRGASGPEVQVTDDGEGIPCDQLEAVFDRFHRVDPARESAGDASGSGLGLTIARAIVRDHGGSIRATSKGVGSGTTFTVALPDRAQEARE